MKKKLRVGVIGCGQRMRAILRLVLEYDRDGLLEIAGCRDPSPLSISDLHEFAPACHQHDSEESLVGDPAIDWIFIGSWNCHHAAQVVAALASGKHVFCEKPLALSIEDCIAVRDAIAKSGRNFFFGLVLRYSPFYQKIAEYLHCGKIGRIISVEFNENLSPAHGGYIFGNWRRFRRNAGTHLLEKCCHDLDLANWLLDSVPVRAASFGGNNFFVKENAHLNAESTYSRWFDLEGVDPFIADGDIVDNQVAILEYANGIRATFHTNCNSALPERRFYICGTLGTVRADAIKGEIEISLIGGDQTIERILGEDGEVGGHAGGDRVMARGIIDTLLNGAEPLASVEEGINSAVAAFGIDQALDEGTIIDLRPLWARVNYAASAKKGSFNPCE